MPKAIPLLCRDSFHTTRTLEKISRASCVDTLHTTRTVFAYKRLQFASATLTLPGNSNALAGIVARLRGIAERPLLRKVAYGIA